MAKEPLTIRVDPTSELARVLAEADDLPVVLDSNGGRCRVSREGIFARYDPQRVRAALRQSAGALAGVDAVALKQTLDRLALEEMAISMVTFMEVYQGTLVSPDPTSAQAKFDDFLAEVPVVPFSVTRNMNDYLDIPGFSLYPPE